MCKWTPDKPDHTSGDHLKGPAWDCEDEVC